MKSWLFQQLPAPYWTRRPEPGADRLDVCMQLGQDHVSDDPLLQISTHRCAVHDRKSLVQYT